MSPYVKVAQSEPSRGGAGTWRRHVDSQAAPVPTGSCSRRSVTIGREQWPGTTCRPRLLDGWMDQLHKRDTTAVRPTFAHTSSTKHQPALSDEGHNRTERPGEQGPRRKVPGGGSRVIRIERATGSRQRRKQFRKCAQKEMKKRAAFAWRSLDARNWRSFSDRYHASPLGPDAGTGFGKPMSDRTSWPKPVNRGPSGLLPPPTSNEFA